MLFLLRNKTIGIVLSQGRNVWCYSSLRKEFMVLFFLEDVVCGVFLPRRSLWCSSSSWVECILVKGTPFTCRRSEWCCSYLSEKLVSILNIFFVAKDLFDQNQFIILLWEFLASCINDEIFANLVNPLGGA